MTRHLAPINWIQWVTLTLAATVAITVPVLYFRINDVQRHPNDALRAIICHGEMVARTSHFFTEVERRRTIRFYDQSLAVAHFEPCDK
jgi:hypothetical protein